MREGGLRAARSLLVPFALVAVTFPGWRPVLDPRFFQSHDGFEHAFRALAVATALQRGVMLPRWVPELALGFGYPLFAVYSPLAYYPPALLSLLGPGILTSLKVDLAALCVACAASAYYASRGMAGRWASVVAAACYACAPYTLANAYVRLDLAELSTFPLTALVAGGLIRLAMLARQRRLAWSLESARAVSLTALPLALLPLAHSLSTLTSVPTLAALSLAVVVASWRAGSARAGVVATLAVGSLALGLSAWFVLPALQWQGWLRLAQIGADSHFAPKLVDVAGLLSSRGGWTAADWFGPGGRRWFFSVAPGRLGELPALPPYAALASAIGAVAAALATRSTRRGLTMALAAAACLSLWLATTWSGGLWQAFPRLTQLQFPWRVVGPASLDVALLSALFVGALPGRARPAVACALLAAAVVPAALLVRPAYRPIDVSSATWPAQMRRELQGGFGTTGSGLFLPRWVATEYPGDFGGERHQEAPSARPPLELQSAAQGPASLRLRYVSVTPRTLTLGMLYAPAWAATIDGSAAPLRPAQTTGLAQVSLPAGSHELRAALRPVAAEAAGLAVTLLAALAGVAALACAPASPAAQCDAQEAWPSEPARVCGGARARRLAPCLPLLAVLLVAAAASGRAGASEEAFASPRPPADSSALGVAAWRLDPLKAWGPVPSLDLLLVARRPIPDSQDVVVRMRRVGDSTWVERRQPPRMGTITTAGWPADFLVDDHVVLPGPRDLCPGAYEVQIGFAPHGAGDAASPQDLGVVDLGAGNTRPCHPLDVDAQPAAFAAVAGASLEGTGAGSPPSLRPGHDLTVDVGLRALEPTDGDDAITVQLLDNLGHVVAQRDSYANVDMVFTSIWRPEDRPSLQLQLLVPADLSVGLYHLDLGLYSGSRARFDPILAPGEDRPIAGLVPLAAFTVRPPNEPVRAPQASFGGLFGLQGVTINGGREAALPGASVPVDLLWQGLAPAKGDYTLFVQVLNAEGRLVAQQDGPPLGGRYPTSAWSAGDVVRERRSITLPPDLAPGAYSVIVGWYAQPSGERLPTVPERPDRAVPIGRLTVTS